MTRRARHFDVGFASIRELGDVVLVDDLHHLQHRAGLALRGFFVGSEVVIRLVQAVRYRVAETASSHAELGGEAAHDPDERAKLDVFRKNPKVREFVRNPGLRRRGGCGQGKNGQHDEPSPRRQHPPCDTVVAGR